MTAMAANGNEWRSLLDQSQDLVSQDNFNFPRVDRNIPQLQQYAESLRARTNKLRSLNNQIAATRLLAQQGFDASRLTQEVSCLEIQPTIEDVFHASTHSVEEYLKQVEESTILAALQEAQQQTVAAFDAHMEDCMSRDWAANKRQLYGLIAPYSAGAAGGVAAPQGGAAAGGGLPLIGTPPRTDAAGRGVAAFKPVVQLSPHEQAYVDVIKKYNQAASSGQAHSVDLVAEFRQAAKASDAKPGSETSMRTCWSVLSDMLAEAKARGLSASSDKKFQDALAAGARKHLERAHVHHMHNTLVRHKVVAERGADPGQLQEVKAYILVKLGPANRGALDFQVQGGMDTAWLQVYYCLRNGWHDAASQAAKHAYDVNLARLGEAGFKAALDEWRRNGGRLTDRTAMHLAGACGKLLKDKTALKQPRQPYMVLVLALLAGDAAAVDALGASLAAQQLPGVLATIEDYMWCKLTLMQASQGSGGGGGLAPSPSLLGGLGGSLMSGGGPGAGVMPSPYKLEELQADINRWPAAYYSKRGQEPLLFLIVLLLSLQFPQALRFMWQDDMTRAYRTDAVHLAAALFLEGMLSDKTGADAGPDVAAMLHAYGRKFVHADSVLALHYYMLAAKAGDNSLAVKGQLLRELLTESRDFGSLLGGGSGPQGGALAAHVPDLEERKRLFEAVAYECQVAAQPEEAVELYLAADRPRQALALLNQQISATMPAAVEEAATGVATTGAADALKRVMTRGRDARDRLTSGGVALDTGSRREVDAYDALAVIWDLLLMARKGRADLALQKLTELACVPLEKARVEHCSRAAQSGLHAAVQERLPDVLAAAADIIYAQKAGATRDRLFVLRNQLDALCMFANSISFRVPRAVYQKLSETAAALS